MWENIDWSKILELLRYNKEAPLLFSSGMFLFLFFFFTLFYNLIKKRPTSKIIYVILFSYYFYYMSSGMFFLLLALTTTVDFALASLMGNAKTKRRRKLFLVLSICFNLGMLGFFKYTNFFGEVVASLLNEPFKGFNLVLPVGISFFTFQSMSYTIDVYRGNITPAKFLLKHNVLAGRLLSVSMQSLESRNWLDFIKSYSSDSIDKGLFLMIAEKTQGLNTSKNMLTLNYSEFVTEYDALVFAGLFGTDAKQSIKEKRYIAALAVSLFGKDAEAVAYFVQSYQIDKEPAEYIMDGLLSDEIIRRRVWEAQILELFPLVVQRTRELIDIWRTQFNDAFDYIDSSRDYPNNKFPNGLTNAYKEPINSPDELEIGTIKFLMGQRRLDSNGNISTDYVLYFYDERTRLCVELLYYLRNRLAHGRVCPAADAERLLRLEVH